MHVRYQDPDDGQVREAAREFWPDEFQARFEEASPMFRLTAAVAEYAEILRESYWAQEGDLDTVLAVAQFAGGALAADEALEKEVAEFVWLVAKAKNLERQG